LIGDLSVTSSRGVRRSVLALGARAGYAAEYQALLLVLVGSPLYGFIKARRERLGQIEETIDMPPELADASPQPVNT
jgi:hypothetical protein